MVSWKAGFSPPLSHSWHLFSLTSLVQRLITLMFEDIRLVINCSLWYWIRQPVHLDKSAACVFSGLTCLIFFLFIFLPTEKWVRGRAIDRGEVDIGTQQSQAIPPGLFWRFHITVHHPTYIKFNLSLSHNALLGVYGRRNIPPTHTQVKKATCRSVLFTRWACLLQLLQIPSTLMHLFLSTLSLHLHWSNIQRWGVLSTYLNTITLYSLILILQDALDTHDTQCFFYI